MANQLKVAVAHAIEVLLERGWSQRQIAGALGIDRGTVAGYPTIGSGIGRYLACVLLTHRWEGTRQTRRGAKTEMPTSLEQHCGQRCCNTRGDVPVTC